MSGFVSEFNSYLKTRTDAPPDFHVHAAMTALAYAAGNNVWMPWYGNELFPNLWVCIIARSGMGKSVPLTMAESMLRKAQLGMGLLPESFSQEALLNTIAAQPNGMFVLQEFSAFVKLLDREYNAGSMQWLTALYDVPEAYTRILQRRDEQKTITLVRPCITILGASSPDWFSDSFKEQQLRGGFLARFMFCPNNDQGTYIDYPGPRDDGVEAGLAGHLLDVSKLKGQMIVEDDVQKIYNEWQRPVRESLKDCPPEFAGMRSRSGLMVMKAAMLMHLSNDPSSLVITKEEMVLAIRYVTNSQKKAEKFLQEEVPVDFDERDVLKLLGVIKRLGGEHVEWGDAMRAAKLSAPKMARAVQTLDETNRIIQEPGRKKPYLSLPIHVPLPPTSNGTNGTH